MTVRPVSLDSKSPWLQISKRKQKFDEKIFSPPPCACVNVCLWLCVCSLSLSLSPPHPTPTPPRVSHILYMLHKTLTFLPDVNCVPFTSFPFIIVFIDVFRCFPLGYSRGFVNTSKFKTARLVDRYTTSPPCGHSVPTMTNTTDCIHRETELSFKSEFCVHSRRQRHN